MAVPIAPQAKAAARAGSPAVAVLAAAHLAPYEYLLTKINGQGSALFYTDLLTTLGQVNEGGANYPRGKVVRIDCWAFPFAGALGPMSWTRSHLFRVPSPRPLILIPCGHTDIT